jgi:hypothetical protein
MEAGPKTKQALSKISCQYFAGIYANLEKCAIRFGVLIAIFTYLLTRRCGAIAH